MTYTDKSLPAGYTAQYVVRAVVPSGNGPESNQISTGLRPAAPTTISVDGESAKLNLTWPSAIGATGYDLYRSSGGAAESGANTLTLYRTWSQISGQVGSSGTDLTWSETPGYGRSYNYTVVATNRWEHLATDPARKSQTREVASGTLENARVNGTAARHERLRPARGGDFTAAATPTFSLALASATSATDYGTTVTWTPATWTGGGPLVVDGKSRDIWWTAQREGATIWTKSTTSPRKDTGTRADITYGYRVQTCNDSGCSPLAAERSILQRPAVPAAPAAALSGLTTRQATITAATSPSATSWQVQKVTGPGSASMGGIKATNGSRQIVYAELGHNAAHTWQSRSTNVAPSGVAGGGTSAWGATGGATTAELRVWLSDGSSTTRSVSARLHNWGGNNANLTVEGFQTQPSNGGGQAHSFDPLTHNTVFTLTARLSDGYNSVAYQDNIRTQTLSTPTISDGWSNTRRIDLTLNAGNGTPQIEIAGEGNRTGNGRYSWDPLRHATTYQAYASNSDGYNSIVIGPVNVGTARLGVSTPSCNASRDGRYAPTTVRFTSSGSLNRSSVHAGSAGYYTALATNSNSDGYNYVSASNDCGISIEAKPLVHGGASGGTPSAVCTQYQGAGDYLFRSAGGPPSGYAFGTMTQQYGIYRGGSIATFDLSCNFFRQYDLKDVDGFYGGSWGQMVFWYQSGSGAS